MLLVTLQIASQRKLQNLLPKKNKLHTVLPMGLLGENIQLNCKLQGYSFTCTFPLSEKKTNSLKLHTKQF